MLERFITAITDLPVIVQGALGSALFALVLYLGQLAFSTSSKWWSRSSRARKRGDLLDELIILKARLAEEDHEITKYAVFILYRAARHVVRALLWLTMGLTFQTAIPVFGGIGYVGCFYYLQRALRSLSLPKDRSEDRMNEIEKQLESLGPDAAKPSKH